MQFLTCCADLDDLKFSRVIELLEKKMKSMSFKLRELRICLDALTEEANAAGEEGFFICIGKKLDL